MIRFEVDSKKIGDLTYGGEIKNYTQEGTVEQLISEMAAAISQMIGVIVGVCIARKGQEDFETFCDLAEFVGKTMVLSALVDAAMCRAKEHDIPVETEELAARFERKI